MIRWYQSGKLILAATFMFSLSALFGGCVRPFLHTLGNQDRSSRQYEQQAQIGDRSIQEREQWRQWYKEQWSNGNIYRKGIEAYNTLTNTGFYSMLYAWDRGQGGGGMVQNLNTEIRVLLSGFKQLDFDQLRNWMEFASELPLNSAAPDLRFRKALDLLNSIQPGLLASWLRTLAEALNRGQFDEVYNTLLPQGLKKVEQAVLLAANPQDRQFTLKFLQELVRQQSELLLAQPQPSGPPAEDVARMIALGTKIALYLLPTNSGLITSPDKVAQFASDWAFLWQVAWASINAFLGSQAANDFTNQLDNVINEILNKYPNLEKLGSFSQPFTCGTGCELVKGVWGLLQWMRPGPVDRGGHTHQYRVDIGAGSFAMLNNVIRQGSTNSPFDKHWQLVGIRGNSESPNPPSFDPKVHSDPFLIFRISDISGKQDIVVVALGNHCAPCDFPITKYPELKGNTFNLITWISQAIDQARNAAGHSARGIVTYGFTNPQASAAQTDAALGAIRAWFAKSDIPILVWRIMPDGTVEYACIGDCSRFTNEEQKSIACKEATGSASCHARPWGSGSQSSYGGDNSSIDPGSDNNSLVGAAPPPLDEPGESIGSRW